MKAVNLLPPDLSGASKATAAVSADTDVPRGPGAFVVLGVLALAVVALAGYVLTSNTIKDRQAELVQLEARQQAASQRVAALKPYAQFDQLAKERVATVRDLAGQRFDWDQTLRDLSRALPHDVTIKTLTGKLDAGGSDDTGTAATSAPTITLTGCTRSQRSVARLMASLRTLNGATSVRLASSQKSDASAGGSEAPCGAGSRPDFNLVVGFGTAAAGGAATPTPTAAATPQSSTSTQTASASTTRGQQASTTSTSTSQGGAVR